MRVGLERKLSAKELMLLNCGVKEDSWVPWTARRSNQSILREISPECSVLNVGRTDVEAETPITLATWCKGLTHWKRLWCGKDWGKEEKGTTEDEMVGWHHWLNGHEFGWTLGVGDGQGGLVCCGSWGRRDSDMTERLIWTELNRYLKCACSLLPSSVLFSSVTQSCPTLLCHLLLTFSNLP